MGGVWSQTQPAAQQPILPPASQESSKKRKASELNQPHPHVDRALSGSSQPQPFNLDVTPDDESHRYIVECPKMYWSSRKDVLKELRKITGMPPYGGVHKIPKWEYFFITFPNASCAQLGMSKLSAKSYRGEKWQVRRTSAQFTSKKSRVNTANTNSCLTAADVTAKWRSIPYDTQIQRKVHQWEDALRLVTKELGKEVKDISSLPWLQDLLGHTGKKPVPCCPLVQVSPANEGSRSYYRNKNELSVGLVRDGQLNIAPVDGDCVTTSKNALAVAKLLTPVLRESGLPPYDKCSHKGYWRQITCRESARTGELIVLFLVNSAPGDECGDFKEKEQSCKTSILQALQTEYNTPNKLGLFWQSSCSSSVSTDSSAEHLFGLEFLHEEVLGLRFRIEPTAFFQVNTNMTEVLYSVIGDLAAVDKNTVVLDVCCGTGTIGLSLASRCHSVVGVELNPEAVKDAQHNARLNGIDNAKFIAGKAEEKIRDSLNLLEPGLSCVAILDPPRAGLQTKVIAALRAVSAIQKVVYVACEPKNLWKNAMGLCRPQSKAFQLTPFYPVKAQGVDLFPHTNHGELAVLFERSGPKLES